MTFNTTLQVHHYSNSKTTLDIVFYTIVVLLGTTGNSVVIWVAGIRMKPNITNVWLVNLAVADLIFCFTRLTSLISLFIQHWPFGDFLCKFMSFFKYTNMFCSVFLLAVISVDRALCVWCPVMTRRKRTVCVARVVTLVVWIVALIFSSPYFVYQGVSLTKYNMSRCSMKDKEADGGHSGKYAYYYIRFFCGFVFPFLVIFVCYTLAAVGIRRTRLSGKSRSLRILALLVFAFFCCWAPYHILGLVKLTNKNHPAVKMGWNMASNLAYFNSCVNPLLYFCTGLNLRRCCNQSLLGIFHRAFTEEGQTLPTDGSIKERSGSVLKPAVTFHQTPV